MPISLQSVDATLMPCTESSFPANVEPIISERDPFIYTSRFQDCMEMAANTQLVAEYLNAHQGWFPRCAHPMQVDPIDANAYSLVIGQFGALGYDVEPKIGLNLLPQENGVFRIVTVPVSGSEPCNDYAVDFHATMQLCETVTPQGSCLTRVEWDLDLTVSVRFPRFIYRLPGKVIQGTGDQLLKQIVRQVSRRLTCKVQQDFHTTYDLPLPKRAASA